MAKREAVARPAAVRRKNIRTPCGAENLTTTGHAIAPSPPAIFGRQSQREREPQTGVPTITFPAVRPAPKPRPTKKRAIGTASKLTQPIAAHPTAERTAP